ncbi:hypothetical protein ABZT43_50910, partial [Streptomyces sp. NPDC005349]
HADAVRHDAPRTARQLRREPVAKPVQVRRAGTTWQCQERPGDPNPYQACIDAQDHTRLVTLSS